MSKSSAGTDPIVQSVRPIKSGVEIDIFLPASLFYFQGHFPGRPILPGVVQIDWAVCLADQYLDTDIGSAQIFQVKFMSVIVPGQSLTVVLQRSPDNRKLHFAYKDETTELSSGSILLEEHS